MVLAESSETSITPVRRHLKVSYTLIRFHCCHAASNWTMQNFSSSYLKEYKHKVRQGRSLCSPDNLRWHSCIELPLFIVWMAFCSLCYCQQWIRNYRNDFREGKLAIFRGLGVNFNDTWATSSNVQVSSYQADRGISGDLLTALQGLRSLSRVLAIQESGFQMRWGLELSKPRLDLEAR